MKVECVQERLQTALLKTARMTGKGASFPILSCVLLEAKGSILLIRATNLDIGIEISIPVKVEREGKIAIPGGIIAQYIASLPNGKGVLLESKQDNLVITTAHGKTTIKGVAHEDFPVIPKISTDVSFHMPIEQFIHGLRSVWYSASTSTIKPELASVYCAVTDGTMYFCATDAFRLAEKKIAVSGISDHKQMLIPIKNIIDIFRALEDVSGEATIAFNENQIAIYFDTVYITSRLIDGIFPDYRQIIPKSCSTKATILKDDLLHALKVATIFSNKLNQSKISFHIREKKIEITTKSGDIGENSESVDVSISGEDIEMTINYRYLLDCFQSLYTDSVSLECTDARKPIVLAGVGDPSFIYLIMPMNIE